jgi:hypothetical protein
VRARDSGRRRLTLFLIVARGLTFQRCVAAAFPKAGRYTFVVADRSSIHNFTLNGPGAANRTITATSFVGTKTVTLTLRRGRYRFYCTVHPTIAGTFRVT